MNSKNINNESNRFKNKSNRFKNKSDRFKNKSDRFKNKEYLPPNKRNNENESNIIINNKNFPELVSNTKNIINKNSNIDFASLFRKKEKKIQKVKPGWVKISKINNQTLFEYGKQKVQTKTIDEETEQKNLINITLDNLIERWQNERDELNEVLGDSSPYWNERNLREPLSDNEYSTEEESEEETDYYSDNDELLYENFIEDNRFY